MTREDERKLFEAYMVLDKIINKSNPKKEILQETLHKVFEEFKNMTAHFAHEVYALKETKRNCSNYCKLSQIQAHMNRCLEEMEREYLEE